MLKLDKKNWHPLGLIVVILLAYLPFYFGGILGDLGDPVTQSIPNKFLIVQYWKSGILPLWNPFVFLGFPLLADMQVGALYLPDLILFAIFEPLLALNLSVLLHLSLAATGFYFFLQTKVHNPWVSGTLSLMMVLTGTYLSKLVFINYLAVIAYLPWVLYLLAKKKSSVGWLAVTLILMVLAGHPVALFYCLMIIAIYGLINCPQKWKQFVPALLIALLSTMVQLLPFLNLKASSVRDALSYEQFVEGSLSYRSLLSFIDPGQSLVVGSVDFFIYFGAVAFLLLCLSFPLFVWKYGEFEKAEKKLYFTGILLFGFGVLLSLGGNFAPLAKLLYQLPFFNIIRVPARYILVAHLGAALALAIFLKYCWREKDKLTSGLLALILINSLITPHFLFEKTSSETIRAQYHAEPSEMLEAASGEQLGLETVPRYFLSSSAIVHPNRHLLHLMPSLIGYNPMILKNYHQKFPLLPVGTFEEEDYFERYYEDFELVGLEYFFFPDTESLERMGYGEKSVVSDFLVAKGWEKVASKRAETSEELGYDLWQAPERKEFAYFVGEGEVRQISFKPGRIELELSVEADDQLIVRQAYLKGWKLRDLENGEEIAAVEYQGLIQSYELGSGVERVEIVYSPREFYWGLGLSLLGLASLFVCFWWERKVS